MKMVHMLWIRVLSIMVCLADISKSEKVNLGAIFSLSTINGKVSNIAMTAAMDDVNSDPSILDGRQLSIRLYDSNSSGFLSIMGGKFRQMPTHTLCGTRTWGGGYNWCIDFPSG